MPERDENAEIESARRYAGLLLKFRLRSVHELDERLRRKNYSRPVIARVLSALRDADVLNDRRFARMWAAERFRNAGRGSKAVRYELQRKGIDRALIDEALAGFDEAAEMSAAQQAARKKTAQTADDSPARRKAAVAAYLRRRGFSTTVIRKITGAGFFDEEP
ncbi:MAG: RecX family transcriptional regulator [Candidatus Omnitrophica bacterium]|nr:RecX family transcriptional regulator [Candidatus Omnitrophota bacterium]